MSNHMKFVFTLSILMFVPVLWHFATVFGYLGEPPQTREDFFIRIGIITAGFVLLSVISASIIAARVGEEEILPDEREWLIETRAERNGGWVLMAGLVGLMWLALEPLEPMSLANVALAILAFGEAVKLVSGLLYLYGRN